MEREESEEYIFGYYADRAVRAIKSDLSKRFQRLGVNITPEQWLILSRLYEKDGQSQVELGEGTYKNAPTVTRIIDLLCDKRLTQRVVDVDDRRKFIINITAEGRATVEKVYPEVLASRKQGWKGLDQQDYIEFIRIIDTIFTNLT